MKIFVTRPSFLTLQRFWCVSIQLWKNRCNIKIRLNAKIFCYIFPSITFLRYCWVFRKYQGKAEDLFLWSKSISLYVKYNCQYFTVGSVAAFFLSVCISRNKEVRFSFSLLPLMSNMNDGGFLIALEWIRFM